MVDGDSLEDGLTSATVYSRDKVMH